MQSLVESRIALLGVPCSPWPPDDGQRMKLRHGKRYLYTITSIITAVTKLVRNLCSGNLAPEFRCIWICFINSLTISQYGHYSFTLVMQGPKCRLNFMLCRFVTLALWTPVLQMTENGKLGGEGPVVFHSGISAKRNQTSSFLSVSCTCSERLGNKQNLHRI